MNFATNTIAVFALIHSVFGFDRAKRNATVTFPRPSPPVFTTQKPQQDIRCYDCKNVNGDCITSVCGGTYCHTQILKNESLNKTIVVTKSCSREGPPGADDMCSFFMVGGTEQVSCYCRCGHYCSNREYLELLYAKAKGIEATGNLFGTPVLSPNLRAACSLYNGTNGERSSIPSSTCLNSADTILISVLVSLLCFSSLLSV